MWRTHMFLVSSVVFIFKRTIFEENSLVCCWVFMLKTGVCKCLKRMFSILQIFKESVYKVRTFLPLKLPPGILRHNVIAYLGAARYLDQEQ